MSGLIGKKIGMTSIFDENGKNIPCTVIEAGPCIVTQVRTEEVDGYSALQLGFDDATEKSATKAGLGHAKKAGTSVKRKVVEFKGFDAEYKLGDAITVEQFREGEFVEVTSRRGKIKAKAQVTEKSGKGVVFMSFHFHEAAANLLTNAALDPVAKIPEYKVCAVKVEKTLIK